MPKILFRKTILVVLMVFGLSAFNTLSAQSLQNAVEKIYNRYDSLKYITFDVRYLYSTDTVNGDFKRDVVNGTFTLAGQKAIYNIGDIQFMQNDSFLISVYPAEKIINVSEPNSIPNSVLPLRSVLDSVMLSYSEHYNVSSLADSSIVTVSLIRADSLAQYDKIVVSYDTSTYFLTSIEYDFQENDMVEPEDTALNVQIVSHKKKFVIQFLNYRVDNFSEKIYDESNYIWFENGECKPSDKYRGYRVYYSKPPVKSNTRRTDVS
ncbi:MAG: hypothetical protein ACTHK0_10980 [Ginsengibacter sp.]